MIYWRRNFYYLLLLLLYKNRRQRREQRAFDNIHIHLYMHIYIYIYIYIYIHVHIDTDIYGIHHCRFFRSSYKRLAWVEFELVTTAFHSNPLTKEPLAHEFYSHSEPNLYNCFSFIFYSAFRFNFCHYLHPSSHLPRSKFCTSNEMSVAEWIHTCGIH